MEITVTLTESEARAAMGAMLEAERPSSLLDSVHAKMAAALYEEILRSPGNPYQPLGSLMCEARAAGESEGCCPVHGVQTDDGTKRLAPSRADWLGL